jgi:four helix bundle protein
MPATKNLLVYDISLQAFSAVNTALDTVPARSGHGYLVNQCRRAISSVVSNIAEGAGRLHGDRAHHLQIAYASAQEASSQLTQLLLLGLLGPDDDVAAAEVLLDRTRAMLWRLARSASSERNAA